MKITQAVGQYFYNYRVGLIKMLLVPEISLFKSTVLLFELVGLTCTLVFLLVTQRRQQQFAWRPARPAGD